MRVDARRRTSSAALFGLLLVLGGPVLGQEFPPGTGDGPRAPAADGDPKSADEAPADDAPA
ncbi:MAG: hypothetical protein D6731_25955, partial [Planctomycetota bacterium]